MTTINYRPHGHHTERAGAADVQPRRLTQQTKLLLAYRDEMLGLTDDEAAQRARLLYTCYWKRCGELRAKGWISTMDQEDGSPMTRMGMSGSQRIVCWITDEGEQHLKSLDQ